MHPCSLNTCTVNIHCHFNCTDLGMRSRTFSLKIKLRTFSEITLAWQCWKIVFIRSDEFTYWISTSNYALNLRYRPHYSEYKELYHTPQNHSTVTTWKICLLVSDKGMFYISSCYSIPKLRCRPLWLSYHFSTCYKALKCNIVHTLCTWVSDEHIY